MSGSNGYLGRAELMTAPARRYADVDVPELGSARVMSPNEAERSNIECSLVYVDEKDKPAAARLLKSRWMAACHCDGDGDRIWSDSEADLEIINGLDSRIVNAIVDKILELAGLADDPQELEKNSETIPAGTLPTA